MELVSGHLNRTRSGENELMLVGDVEEMDSLNGLVPSVIWFEFFDHADDISSRRVATLGEAQKEARSVMQAALNDF